jgi:serine/threonine protein kinase
MSASHGDPPAKPILAGDGGEMHAKLINPPAAPSGLPRASTVSLAGIIYTITSKLGQGTFAEVYEAQDIAGARVAIKRMKYVDEAATCEDRTLAQEYLELAGDIFQAEVRRQSKASRVGVAPAVLGSDPIQGLIAMELLPKDKYMELDSVQDNAHSPLSSQQQMAFLTALARLRANNITYRDTNFRCNVFFPISPSEKVKIIDYGDIGERSRSPWVTLYAFCRYHAGYYYVPQIAGVMRDHPDWFELPHQLLPVIIPHYEAFASHLARFDSAYDPISYSYDARFEASAKHMLTWSLNPKKLAVEPIISTVNDTAVHDGTSCVEHVGASCSKSDDLAAGHSILLGENAYTIVRKLGAGSFAVVYAAKDARGKMVVLKCMRPDRYTGMNPAHTTEAKPALMAAEFDREVNLQQQASALDVAPKVIEADATTRVIVMQYLFSSKYKQMSVLANNTDDPFPAWQQLALLRGLAKLKAAGITCRDANFMLNVFFPVDPSDSVKIIDFGRTGCWNPDECTWKTLFAFVAHNRGCYCFNHIAGWMRDHPDWFGFSTSGKEGTLNPLTHNISFYLQTLQNATKVAGTSFSSDEALELEARKILQPFQNHVSQPPDSVCEDSRTITELPTDTLPSGRTWTESLFGSIAYHVDGSLLPCSRRRSVSPMSEVDGTGEKARLQTDGTLE